MNHNCFQTNKYVAFVSRPVPHIHLLQVSKYYFMESWTNLAQTEDIEFRILLNARVHLHTYIYISIQVASVDNTESP
jgi:hypothetical protein